MSQRIMRWSPIGRCPAYEVSEDGRVRRAITGRVDGPAARFEGKFIKPRRHNNAKQGYWTVGLWAIPGRHKVNCLVHQLVADAFLPPKPSPSHEVAHWDRDVDNNHYTNLRWATRQENIADRIRHGTNPIGESNPMARLTEQQVIELRDRHQRGDSVANLAKAFQIAEETARRAVVGISWRHLL